MLRELFGIESVKLVTEMKGQITANVNKLNVTILLIGHGSDTSVYTQKTTRCTHLKKLPVKPTKNPPQLKSILFFVPLIMKNFILFF